MPPKKAKPKSKMSKQPIPEDYELSSSSEEQPKYITLTEEQRLTSKNIIIECPLCNGKIQLRNEISINPKTGIVCKCSPLSFKLSKTDKSVNVSRDDTGEIKLDCQDHSISLSFNRITTPESDEEKKRYEMISEVMTPRQRLASPGNTPRNVKKQHSLEDMD